MQHSEHWRLKDSNHIVVDTRTWNKGPGTTLGGSLKFPHRNNGSSEGWKVEGGETVYKATVAVYARCQEGPWLVQETEKK